MNPVIYELFELIEQHDIMDCFLKDCPYMKKCRDLIQEISTTLNPQIPEPWASMSADEIIKGLGVYR